MKTSVSCRLEEKLFKRAERLAVLDRRTLANVIEMCVIEYLPTLEKEVLGSQSEPTERKSLAGRGA